MSSVQGHTTQTYLIQDVFSRETGGTSNQNIICTSRNIKFSGGQQLVDEVIFTSFESKATNKPHRRDINDLLCFTKCKWRTGLTSFHPRGIKCVTPLLRHTTLCHLVQGQRAQDATLIGQHRHRVNTRSHTS